MLDIPESSARPTTASATPVAAARSITDSQWKALSVKIRSRNRKSVLRQMLGEATKVGAIYRWGVGVASGGGCSETLEVLSRLACASRIPKRLLPFNYQRAAQEVIDSLGRFDGLSESDDGEGSLRLAETIAWAAAMPELTRELKESLWWDLLGALQQLREVVMQRDAPDSVPHLMIGGELGLTLSWRIQDAPSCKRLEATSLEAFADWCRHEETSLSNAISDPASMRLVLASLIRCHRIVANVAGRKIKKQQREVAASLATWVAASTITTGGSAFSTAERSDLKDDLSSEGLLGQAIEFDTEALQPAMKAALGKSQSGGRLAWEVCLPESFHHSEDAKLAILLPEWDVRRGRLHVDYSGEDQRIEMFAGRTMVVSGRCQTMIESDGVDREPCGPWQISCEYSDDDVHYLELEQPWTGDLTLQRQWMLVRDDRCLLMADGVLPKSGITLPPESTIRYDCRIPLADTVVIDPEPETRDFFFSDGKRRGLVMPLSAAEWRVGATSTTARGTDDGCLAISSRGCGRLYVPLWFDFQQRRFNRKRTWRQLTVADQLRIVDHSEAAAFRVQIGSQHWMIYRSLDESVSRSVLGKHLVADFFAARFDPSDGSFEELVTVDENELIDG